MLSETEKDKIQHQAKKILDSFASALEGVNYEEKNLKRPVSGFREERTASSPNPKFRQAIFHNAPKKDKDCIIAEKKQW